MRYAKLIYGYPQYAPRKVHYHNKWIYNPPADILIELGYKEVQFADYPSEEPDEGYYWEETWRETQNKIIQEWVLAPNEEGEENEGT